MQLCHTPHFIMLGLLDSITFTPTHICQNPPPYFYLPGTVLNKALPSCHGTKHPPQEFYSNHVMCMFINLQHKICRFFFLCLVDSDKRLYTRYVNRHQEREGLSSFPGSSPWLKGRGPIISTYSSFIPYF